MAGTALWLSVRWCAVGIYWVLTAPAFMILHAFASACPRQLPTEAWAAHHPVQTTFRHAAGLSTDAENANHLAHHLACNPFREHLALDSALRFSPAVCRTQSRIPVLQPTQVNIPVCKAPLPCDQQQSVPQAYQLPTRVKSQHTVHKVLSDAQLCDTGSLSE